MRVIVYSREQQSALDMLGAVRSLAPATEVETCSSCSLCEEKLARTRMGEAVVVALAADGVELAALFLLRERLMDIPLVLILPDDSGETVCLGHRLRPRFVGFSGSGFGDAAAVVARLLTRMESVQQAGS